MKRPPKKARIVYRPEDLAAAALRTLLDRKAQEPVILEVKGLSTLGDYFIICSGGSRRHVQAMAHYVLEALEALGVKPLGVEGLEEGNWVLLDFNDVIIHLFLKPLREFYDLEGLWLEAGRPDLESFVSGQAKDQPAV